MVNKEIIPPCGLYCGLCGIYQATQSNNRVLLEKFAKAYNASPDDLVCHGCRSDTVSLFCRVCSIKACAAEKEREGCHQCDAFPCEKIESFPIAEGKKNILRSVPLWRSLGTEKWIGNEEKLFSCRSCGTRLFRGAKKCRNCNTVVGQ